MMCHDLSMLQLSSRTHSQPPIFDSDDDDNRFRRKALIACRHCRASDNYPGTDALYFPVRHATYPTYSNKSSLKTNKVIHTTYFHTNKTGNPKICTRYSVSTTLFYTHLTLYTQQIKKLHNIHVRDAHSQSNRPLGFKLP